MVLLDDIPIDGLKRETQTDGAINRHNLKFAGKTFAW